MKNTVNYYEEKRPVTSSIQCLGKISKKKEINNYDLPFDKVICHLLALWLGEGGVRHLVHKAGHKQGINIKRFREKESRQGTKKGQEGKIDFMTVILFNTSGLTHSS